MFDIGPRQVKTALISVSDKTGIELFAKRVEKAGVRLLSTGGTARLLRATRVGHPARAGAARR